MDSPDTISFQKLLEALLDEEVPFNPRYLYRFSDLDRGDLSQLRDIWDRVSSWRRQALLEDLEQLGENDYLLSFEALGRFALQDEDPKVRTTAVRVLWEYEEQDLIPYFLNLMNKDSDLNVRAVAASALGKFVYLGEIEELPQVVLRKIEDNLLSVINGFDDYQVRRRALESIGYSGRGEVNSLIKDAYESGDKDWLASALFAMGRSANEEWEEEVLRMLNHPIPTVRVEAVRAAGELEFHNAAVALLELLEDDNEDVRQAAIWSLSQIGGEGVRETLETILEESEDDFEIDLLESALDNLSFTEDMQLMPLFDLPEGELDGVDEDLDEIESVDYLSYLEEDDFEDDEDY